VLELTYSARSFENARKARRTCLEIKTTRKRYDGYLAGLLDPQIWSALEARERKLRDAIGHDAKFKSTLSALRPDQACAGLRLRKTRRCNNYLEQERPVTVGYRGPQSILR